MSSKLAISENSGIKLEFVPDYYKDEFIKNVLEYYKEVSIREKTNDFPCIEEDISNSLIGHYFQGCLALDTGMEMEFTIQLNEAEATDSYDFWWDHLWSLYVERDFDSDLRHEFDFDIERVLNFHNMSYYTVYASPFSMVRTYYIHNAPIVEVW